MSYELFIFDFDGTLADSRHNVANSVNRSLDSKGYATVSDDLIFPTIGKLPIQTLFKQLYEGIDDEEIDDLTQQFRTSLLQNAKDELQLFPEVETTLQSLKDRDKQLAILTTKNTQVINELLISMGIAALFSVVYGSGVTNESKPSGACIQYIWEKLPTRIRSEHTVMVGDTSVDLETAQNTGVDSIGVTYGIDGDEILGMGFTSTIDSFGQLLKYL
jgi:phosphoglycolate phosphatase